MNEKIFEISRVVVALVALLQLALSQIQIGVMTNVFATDIGFYYFLFVIFGLVMLANANNVKKKNNTGLLIGGTILSSAAGFKYLFILLNDVNEGHILVFSDITVALIMTIVTLVVYIVGCVCLLITKRRLENV
jgi:hypothetical protein